MVQQRRRPSGFIEPCQPSKVARPPSGPLWVRKIKHDGYRLMVRRDGSGVRCFTRNGHDWADRFPAIVDAALRIKASSFLLDGEAVIVRDDGTPDFRALRSRRWGNDVRFDLIGHDGRCVELQRSGRPSTYTGVPRGACRVAERCSLSRWSSSRSR
jgi:bifunctional non-homologous end joining protein LigD